MCYFKSFVYSLEKKMFFHQVGVDSHSEICSISKILDDNCIKFELEPYYYSGHRTWCFKIDHLGRQLYNDKLDDVLRCFNTLPEFIMKNISEWTKEGIDRGFIDKKFNFYDEKSKEVYHNLFNELKEAKKQLSNSISKSNIETMEKFEKVLKQEQKLFNFNNEQEILLISKRIKEAKKNSSYWNKKVKILTKKTDDFTSKNGLVTIEIKPLTLENITEQIDEAFSNYRCEI